MPPPARGDDAEQARPMQAENRQSYGSTPGEQQDVYELADVMDGFGIRTYHYRVLLLSWVLQICPASVVMATPFVLKSIREEYGVNRPTVALIGSAVTLGAVCGVLLFGPLHDHIGRKRSNLLAVLGIGVLAVLHVALPSHLEDPGQVEVRSFVCLVTLRFAIGIFFGGAAGYALLHFVEFLPSRLRGLMMTMSSMGWSLGTLYSIWVASAFSNQWRVVLASPILACLLAFPTLLFGPESPRWLFAVGREQESKAVLSELAASRRLLSPELPTRTLNAVPERVLLSHKAVDPEKDTSLCADVRTLFGPQLRRVTIVTMVIQVSVNGASYVNLIWLPEILTGLLDVPRVPYEMFVYSEMVGWAPPHPGRLPGGDGAVDAGVGAGAQDLQLDPGDLPPAELYERGYLARHADLLRGVLPDGPAGHRRLPVPGPRAAGVLRPAPRGRRRPGRAGQGDGNRRLQACAGHQPLGFDVDGGRGRRLDDPEGDGEHEDGRLLTTERPYGEESVGFCPAQVLGQ